jgi:hypothetical protein
MEESHWTVWRSTGLSGAKLTAHQRSLATVKSNGYGAPDIALDCPMPTTELSDAP